MTRLVRVELRRLTARRLTRVVLVVAAVGVLLALANSAWEARPTTAEERAFAERQFASAQEQSGGFDVEVERQRCLEEQERQQEIEPGIDFGCDEIAAYVPSVEDFLARRPLDVAAALPGAVLAGAVALAFVAFLVGASSIGAEWAAGTVATLLLVEPRRTRVWAAKAAALAATTAVAGLVLLAVSVVGLYGIAGAWGTTEGLTAELARDTAWSVLRGAILVAAGALVGYAIAGTVRHTAAAGGVVLAYLVGGEVLTRTLLGIAAERWLASSNVIAWVAGRYEAPPSYDCSRVDQSTGECLPEAAVEVSQAHGAAHLGLVLAACLLGFLVTFRRRDLV